MGIRHIFGLTNSETEIFPISLEDRNLLQEFINELQVYFDGETKGKIIGIDEFDDIQDSNPEKRALLYFERICELMEIPSKEINVQFYSEGTLHELGDSIMTQWDENQKFTSGWYDEDEGGTVTISMEEKVLRNSEDLIATIVHELCHYKLLHEKKAGEIDEIKTDLLMILYGFGLFGANSSVVKMKTWGSAVGSGWNITGGSGYLSPFEWGYSLAYYYHANDKSQELQKAEASMHKEIFKIVGSSLKFIDNYD